MQRLLSSIAFCALMQLCTLGASAAEPSTVRGYNFTYRISGDPAIAPLQVFDDGKRMYLQFRDVTLVPAIFADTTAGQLLLRPGDDYDVRAPYLVLRRIEPGLVLTMAKRRAVISSTQPGPVSGNPIAFGSAHPSQVTSSPSAPLDPAADKAARVARTAAPLPGPTSAGATDHPDETISPSVAEPAQETWVLKEGATISEQLAAWAASAKWKFKWRIDDDWIVPSTVTYHGTFESALSAVIEQLYAEGKPVQLKAWAGNHYSEVINNAVK